MLIDRTGSRIDSAPVSIVHLNRGRDVAITNGITCITCHAHTGLIEKVDEALSAAEYLRTTNPSQFELITLLHDRGRMASTLREDQRLYGSAVDRLRSGTHFGEAVEHVTDRYRANIPIERAAAEFGLDVAAFRARVQTTPSAGATGRVLSRLLAERGELSRDAMQCEFGALIREINPRTFASRPARAEFCPSGSTVRATAPNFSTTPQVMIRALPSTNHPRAAECELRNSAACIEVGRALRDGTARLRADPARSTTFFREACTLGALEGCISMAEQARLHRVAEVPPTERVRLLQPHCETDAWACFELAHAIRDAAASPDDDRRALQTFERSCRSGHYAACTEAGDMTLAGRGTATNTARARQWHQFGCQRGNMQSCSRITGGVYR